MEAKKQRSFIWNLASYLKGGTLSLGEQWTSTLGEVVDGHNIGILYKYKKLVNTLEPGISNLNSPELQKCYFLYNHKQIRSKVPIIGYFILCLSKLLWSVLRKPFSWLKNEEGKKIWN